jgi:hypothetical protein
MKAREINQKEKSKERAIRQKEKEDKENEKYLKTHWERIGTYGMPNSYPDEIPKWLLEKNKSGGTGIFKGKTFVYKVGYNGGKKQGDGYYIYYRKLRSDVKYDPSKHKE